MGKVHINVHLNQPAIDGDQAKCRICLMTPFIATWPNPAAIERRHSRRRLKCPHLKLPPHANVIAPPFGPVAADLFAVIRLRIQ